MPIFFHILFLAFGFWRYVSFGRNATKNIIALLATYIAVSYTHLGDQVGYIPYLSDFWSAINELKPAHLAAELAWMSLGAVTIRTAWGLSLIHI